MKKMIKNTLVITLLMSVSQAFGEDLKQESSLKFEQVTFHNNTGKEIKITVSGKKSDFVTAPQDYSESKKIAAGESASFNIGRAGNILRGFDSRTIEKVTVEIDGKPANLPEPKAGDYVLSYKKGELYYEKGELKINPPSTSMPKHQDDKLKRIPRFIPGWQTMQKAPASH